MGIDYVIPYPCENRRDLGEAGLRRWTFLYMIQKYLQEHPDLSRDSLEGKQWNLPTISGGESSETKFDYSDIRHVAERIGKHIKRCHNCAANMDPKADEFGCVGRINYPLQACFEEFLAERLQKVIDLRSPEEWPALLNLILRHDSPFDGKPVAKLRATVLKNGSRLLERKQPVPFLRAGDGISTDHILHALLGMSSPTSSQTGYAREVPVELLNIYLDFLSGALYASLSEERVLELSRSCSTYLQFRWLHRALRIAYKLGTPLLLN